MDSILEQQRLAHEEAERLEQAIVDESLKEPKSLKERLVMEHRINEYLERIQRLSQRLKTLYVDADGTRTKEIAAISGPEELTEFYQRLRTVKEYHRKNPNQIVDVMEMEFRERDFEKDAELLDKLFSGEESGGRFLDLHALHDQYLNLKDVKRINYVAFLEQVDRLDLIPRNAKVAQYRSYLKNLREYFENYFKRTQPLLDLQGLRDEAQAEFDEQWAAGTFPGWTSTSNTANGNADALYCQACRKQYSKQTVYDAHLTSRKHQKAAEVLAQNGTTTQGASIEDEREKARVADEQKRREQALEEAFVRKYAKVLEPQREATRANVERKQALTENERRMELEAEAAEAEVAHESDEEGDEDEDARIYNPLNLPLGWDGKPIPYWLYKLHGLGVEYPCEICGNFIYMGRKAFERHFQEWRHAHGMRCLGIPNTKHFQDVTLIEDAYTLWNRLKKERKSERHETDAVEEYEDQAGNIFNKKTYEDLRRQGLL